MSASGTGGKGRQQVARIIEQPFCNGAIIMFKTDDNIGNYLWIAFLQGDNARVQLWPHGDDKLPVPFLRDADEFAQFIEMVCKSHNLTSKIVHPNFGVAYQLL